MTTIKRIELDDVADKLFGDDSCDLELFEAEPPPLKAAERDVLEVPTASSLIKLINAGIYCRADLTVLKNAVDRSLKGGINSLSSRFPPGTRVKFMRRVTRRAKWPSGTYWGIVEKTLQKRIRVQVYCDPYSPHNNLRDTPVTWKCSPASLVTVSDDDWDNMIRRITNRG